MMSFLVTFWMIPTSRLALLAVPVGFSVAALAVSFLVKCDYDWRVSGYDAVFDVSIGVFIGFFCY